MKNKILIFAVLLLGIIIWGCNQDDDLNNDGMHRYSAEEIATLHSLAEKYGIPEVQFITESEFKLPSLNEMDETFRQLSAMKTLSSWPMEVTDSTEQSITYKSRSLPYTRIQNGTIESSNGYDYSTYVSAIGTNLWLSVSVTKTVISNNGIPKVSYSASVSLEMPDDSFFTKDEKTDVTVNGPGVSISYRCDICKRAKDEDSSMMVVAVLESFSYDKTVYL